MRSAASRGSKKLILPGLLWTQWEKTVRKNPRRLALIEAEKGSTWTAQALQDEAVTWAEALAGWARGTRVGFCLPNGAGWMAFFLATQKNGLTAVPLDAGLPEAAAVELAKQLRCGLLYFQGKFHPLPSARINRDGACCLKVTSGSSGDLPKTVHCRAEHLLADGTHIIRTMGIRPDDRNLATIPLGHSYGLGNFVMPLILQGTPVICATHFLPRQIGDWIKRYRATVLPSVPAIFRVLALLPGRSRLTPLRVAISAGAPLTVEIAQAFFKRYGLKLHNFYGSSETGGICYDRGGNAALGGKALGKPMLGVKVTIQRGIIEVESDAVAKRSGRWRMPDRGEWNKKGELVFLGRHGREVNLGGKKVHPSEVEQALRGLPGVSDAAVWAAPHAERMVLLAAVESRLREAEVHHALAGKLPEWKIPRHYVITTEFPRTARGKVDMAALRQKMAEQVH